jgi:molybdopterin synthase catalytic subunit
MRIRVRYFAALREMIGQGEEAFRVPEEARAGDIRNLLLARYPQLQVVMERALCAVNHRYVPVDTVLRENDELVFIPPTGGGAPLEPVIHLTRDPLDRNALIDAVSSPDCGGVVVFEGVVRNHARGKQVDHLEYEMYEEMAREQIQAIIHEAQQRWGVERIALAHRAGRVEIGEASVIIVVASPHRAEAFDACRYIIDTLKATVTIWKKEVTTTGEEWVEG